MANVPSLLVINLEIRLHQKAFFYLKYNTLYIFKDIDEICVNEFSDIGIGTLSITFHSGIQRKPKKYE